MQPPTIRPANRPQGDRTLEILFPAAGAGYGEYPLYVLVSLADLEALVAAATPFLPAPEPEPEPVLPPSQAGQALDAWMQDQNTAALYREATHLTRHGSDDDVLLFPDGSRLRVPQDGEAEVTA